MTRTSANTNDIWSADDDRVTFASRFLKATGEYALAMFGAMFLAFLWMAKDVMLGPVSSVTVKALGDFLVLAFVTRRVWGYDYDLLVRILEALGFVSVADLIKKNEIDANEGVGRGRTP